MPYTIAQFFISDENLLQFRRWVKKPQDCVLNALEILGVLQATPADLMRIAVGDHGLNATQIEEIFTYVYPPHRWRFVRYTNIHTLEQFAYQGLQSSHVVFCGYQKNGFKHVFLIGKTNTGHILYIDPQINEFCPLENAPCYQHIRDAQEYFILQSTLDPVQIQQLQAKQGVH